MAVHVDRRRIGRGAVSLGLALGALAKWKPVDAYPREVNSSACTWFSIKFNLIASPNWASLNSSGQSMQDAFNANVVAWNTLRDPSGAQYVSVGYPTGHSIDVVWAPPPGATGAFAAGVCDQNTMYLNPAYLADFQANPLGFAAVVEHETGHLLKLGHTGPLDSIQDGIRPLMSTCSASVADGGNRTLSADDAASIASHFPTLQELSGNFGFENTSRWMSFVNSVPADTFQTTSSFQGGYGYKFRAVSASSPQDSYITTAANIENTLGASGVRVVAAARSRKENAAHTGATSVQLKYRTVSYPSPANNCFYWVPNKESDHS